MNMSLHQSNMLLSYAGGFLATITGSAFSVNTAITFESTECQVLSATYDTIICRMPEVMFLAFLESN